VPWRPPARAILSEPFDNVDTIYALSLTSKSGIYNANTLAARFQSGSGQHCQYTFVTNVERLAPGRDAGIRLQPE